MNNPVHNLPRSSTELFPEALRLSPKQREVLNTLQKYPQGARAAELAEALDMHVNTARGHLDELVNAGAVRVITSPAKGRGRPSLIFQVRIPDNRSIAEEYIGLISLLTEMLADSAELMDYQSAKAREIGRRWAQSLSLHMDDTDPLAPLFRKLRDMGFDPTLHQPDAGGAKSRTAKKNSGLNSGKDAQTGEPEIDLHACPFVAAGVKPTPFLCAIHDGYLNEAIANASGNHYSLELVPMSGNRVCKLRVKENA